MSTSLLTTAICNGRNHVKLTYYEAYGYCTLLAVSYVASLYCLVPTKVRQLRNRDDPLQIQWRAFATSFVCVIAVTSYRSLFCESSLPITPGITISSYWDSDIYLTLKATCAVLIHTSILYVGVYIRIFLLIYDDVRKRERKVTPSRLFHFLYIYYGHPIGESIMNDGNMQRWIVLRNLVIAPITEEIVFRSCIVSVLSSTGMTVSSVCFVAPLFFAFAHAHHAILRLRLGHSVVPVVLTTTFQLVYTSIFGAYASYTYQRTASLLAVVLCHSMCNALGLPDLSFFQPSSSLYSHRMILLFSLVFGFIGFMMCVVLYDLPPVTIAKL